nr:putative ribonuclease H-like domain-containing protein [Tanacetum cinerariifolium]
MEAKEKRVVLDAKVEAFLADVECTAHYDDSLAITTTAAFKVSHEDAYDSDVYEAPHAATDLHKTALGHSNLKYIKTAQLSQPTSYIGDVVVNPLHTPHRVHDNKATLVHVEVSRTKMLEKMKDPEVTYLIIAAVIDGNLERSEQESNKLINKAGLEYVEARLEVYKKNEVVFEEDIKILKLDVMFRDKAITELRQKFKQAKKERDDLKLTLENFKGSSKNLSRLLDSQLCDKYKTGLGAIHNKSCRRKGLLIVDALGDLKEGKITGKDTECVVLSPSFNLLDESQVLLRVPKKNNMYNVDLRNVAPSRGPKCSEEEVADDARTKSTEVPRKKNEVQDPAKEGDKNDQEKVVRNQDEALRKQFERESERLFGQGEAANTNSTNRLNTVSSLVNAASSSFTTMDPGRERTQRNNGAYDDEVEGAVADFNNLELTKIFSPIPITRIYKDHPKEQIIGEPLSSPQTRRMTKILKNMLWPYMVSIKLLEPEFEGLMHKKFQISSIGKLTFFLGLQVMQRDDGHFFIQDKYVADILKKFDFSSVKTISTLIETNKALLKDEEAVDVDVYLYRSMIGSLMYLTSFRLDIMFTVCACARFQVTPKVLHLHAMKRIFRYLKCQPKLGL